MQHILLGVLMSNSTATTKLGGKLNAVELLHTTTINTLNSIRLSLAKHIENLESKNEWITDNASQEALNKAKAYASSILAHCSNVGRAYGWCLYARLKIWRYCFDYKSTH